MRTMSYTVKIRSYTISNGGDPTLGDIENPPISLTLYKGLKGAEYSTSYDDAPKKNWEDIIVVDKELDGIYDEVLAGKTDYVLTAIEIRVVHNAIALTFIDRNTDDIATITAFGRKDLLLQFEVDQGRGKAPDTYKLYTNGKASNRTDTGEKHIKYSPHLSAWRSTETQYINFDEHDLNDHNAPGASGRWAIITETRY